MIDLLDMGIEIMTLDEIMNIMFGPVGDDMRDEFERIVKLSYEDKK